MNRFGILIPISPGMPILVRNVVIVSTNATSFMGVVGKAKARAGNGIGSENTSKVVSIGTKKWSTPDAARKMGVSEDEIYKSLSNLAKHIKDNIWIYYEDGGLRIVAE